LIAIEAGWTVTEVGRQPFIITDLMRTAEAVTPVPYLTIPLFTFTLVYLFLAFVVVFLLLRQFRQSPRIVRQHVSDASITGGAAEVPRRVRAGRQVALDHLAQEVGGLGGGIGLGGR